MEIQELVKTLEFSTISWEIITPIICNILDFLTGFISAIINKEVDSTKMRNGLLHKFLLILLLFLSFIIDLTFKLSIISKTVSIYIIVMEIISVFENMKKAGIDITFITNILKNEGKW